MRRGQVAGTTMCAYVLPGLVEEAPMYRATIRAGFAVKGAQAAGAGASVKRRGRTVELTAADIHTVVVLRY